MFRYREVERIADRGVHPRLCELVEGINIRRCGYCNYRFERKMRAPTLLSKPCDLREQAGHIIGVVASARH